MTIFRSVPPAMRRLATRLRCWGERGATSVEYAIMAAGIAAVIIVAVVFLGQETEDKFDCTKQSVEIKTDQCASSP